MFLNLCKLMHATEFPKLSLPLPPSAVKHMLLIDELDDLPEFDFGTICGNAFSSVSMSINVSIASKLPIER